MKKTKFGRIGSKSTTQVVDYRTVNVVPLIKSHTESDLSPEVSIPMENLYSFEVEIVFSYTLSVR